MKLKALLLPLFALVLSLACSILPSSIRPTTSGSEKTTPKVEETIKSYFSWGFKSWEELWMLEDISKIEVTGRGEVSSNDQIIGLFGTVEEVYCVNVQIDPQKARSENELWYSFLVYKSVLHTKDYWAVDPSNGNKQLWEKHSCPGIFREKLYTEVWPTLSPIPPLISPSPQPQIRNTVQPSPDLGALLILDGQGNVIYKSHAPETQGRYLHWINFVRTQLEAQYDSQAIYRSGFTVYTTIDSDLQDFAERIVKQQLESLTTQNITNGALVVIQPYTGEILAMVGSADFYNEAIHGQVNMAVSPTRQPGTAIMPLIYLTAFEKGWTPATLIWDVPTSFPPSGDPNDPLGLVYSPVNYDGRFHGPVTVRTALANSFNIPAVKALQFIGVFDDTRTPQLDGLIGMANRLGITSLTRTDYGLGLALGGGEVSLLELTYAYAVIANGGLKIPPVAITKIVDRTGNVVYEYKPPVEDQVIRPEHSYLISSILSDNEARTPMFGANSIINLAFPSAVKTGTTTDFRDNWTIGYTPDLVVGVWVGNADYSPMINTTVLTSASMWAEFMSYAVPKLTDNHPTPFTRPTGVVDHVICSVSGTKPSEWCPYQRSEVFVSDQPPLFKEQDLWTKVFVDTWTGYRASLACGSFTKEEYAANISDIWAQDWLKNTTAGQSWVEQMGFKAPLIFAPERECRSDDSRPILAIVSPTENQTINTISLDIIAQVDATSDFSHYNLDYGIGNDPLDWIPLSESNLPVKQADNIFSWDLKDVPNGPVTLRLLLNSTRGTYAELHVQIQVEKHP